MLDFWRRLFYTYLRSVKYLREYGHLAQLVEHPLDVRKVMGSSPLVSTKTKSTHWVLFVLVA